MHHSDSIERKTGKSHLCAVYGFGPLCIGERNWLLEGQIPNPRAPSIDEHGTLGVTRLAGRTGQGWSSLGWAGQESGEVTGAARACVICVHAYLFPGGFFVNKPEIAFAALRYSPRQYTVLSLL